MTIHDLPPADRPRERLQRIEVEALSAQEIRDMYELTRHRYGV